MELRECPFCGETPLMHTIAPHRHAMLFEGIKMPDHPGSVVIECGCGAGLIDDTCDKVLERWNRRATQAPSEGADARDADCHGLDTPERVRFYEHDFYVLSNFSAFGIEWSGRWFPTSEHAYHWEKFYDGDPRDEANCPIAYTIMHARSAHDAFKYAEQNKAHRRSDWDDVKVGIMRDILRAKAAQHEYVRRKLLATGDRELVEDSWRDDFWGWGPNRDGQNMLGKLWMEVRAEIRAAIAAEAGEKEPTK